MNSQKFILIAGFLFVTYAHQLSPGAELSPNAPDRHAGAYRNILAAMHTKVQEVGLPDKCGLSAITYAFSIRTMPAAPLRSDALVLLTRPDLQKSRLIGNYRIHYDTSTQNTPALLDASHQRIPGTADAFADSVGSVLGAVAQYETVTLGYPPPPSDGTEGGGPEFDVYILDLGNLYGYTTPENAINSKPDGGTYTTFMTIDNDFSFVFPDSNKGMPALRVTLAHEFHHAIQIGNYGYWTNDVFYYEMTSTWMEEVVFPRVKDYLQYVRSSGGQFRNPEVPFATANNIIEYSRAVWCHFIAKQFGRDAVKRSWELIQTYPPLQAIDNSLQQIPYSSSLRRAFPEWTLWNYYTGSRADTARYYPEGNLYPLMTQAAVGFSPPSRDVTGTLSALAAYYYQVVSDFDTLTLAMSNLNLASLISNPDQTFFYTIHLNVNNVDGSYVETAAHLFYKLDVSDPTNWDVWSIVGGNVGPSGVAAGTPFPNPFHADGSTSLYIPVPGSSSLSGSLYFFSSSMDLVYSAHVTSSSQLGKQVLSWNGTTNANEAARSGVYFYMFLGDSPNDITLKGKFALLRK